MQQLVIVVRAHRSLQLITPDVPH